MSRLTIGVIIPAYRAARTIARALNSVIGQARPPDEILIIDDGSPDDLAAAIAPYRDRVRLIAKSNGGAASARNLGLESIGTDAVAFLDADDYWEPDKLRLQEHVLADHPKVGLVAGRFYSQLPGQDRREPAGATWPAKFLDCSLRLQGAVAFSLATRIWTTTVIVRREIIENHRFVPGLEPAEDRDLWVRLVTSTSTYVISEPLATNVLEPNSLSRSDVAVDCGNMLRVVRRHEGLLGPRQARAWEADTYRRWAAGHLSEGRPRDAFRPALARLRRQPLSAQAWYIVAKAASLSATQSPARIKD